MQYRLGLTVILLLSSLLTGCCGFTSCFSDGWFSSNTSCGGPICCPTKEDHTYDCCYYRCHRPFCPRICPAGGCNKLDRMNQLACQGVQVVELGNRVDIILYTDNCLDRGTANFDQSCYQTMDNIAALIKAYGDICPPIKVTGYTDHIGDVCEKWDLSRQIADSVVAYLWTRGVTLHMLCSGGCACTHSIASVHTTCGNAFNRRVEITFWRSNRAPYWQQSA